jgi:hypothetical protein
MGLTFNLGRISPSVFTDSSLNVGIGAAPSGSYKLEVTGTGRFTDGVIMATTSGVVSINTTGRPAGVGGGDNGKLWVKQATTGNYGIASIASASDSFTYIAHNGTNAVIGTSYGTTGSYTNLLFQTSDATRMTISSTGAATFTGDIIYNNAGNQNAIITSGAANRGRMYLYDAGTAAIALQAGQDSYFLGGNFGIGLTSPSSKLEISQTASATWSTIVRIAPSTGACYGILSTIQNQSPNNTSSFLYYGDDSTAARFIVYSNGGIANYTANNNPLSDERLKKEITPLESVWDKVKAIKVVKYKFNDQTHDDFNMGVIAQQVEMVAPELVNLEGWGTLAEDGTPYKSIWENDMNYYTMKALQEAMTKIEELSKQNEELSNRLIKLENK